MKELPDDVKNIVSSYQYYPYEVGCTDKYISGMLWYVCGLYEVNEIMVICRYKDKLYSKKDTSGLLYPPMIDRVFGMDINDYRVSYRLCDELIKELEEKGIMNGQ